MKRQSVSHQQETHVPDGEDGFTMIELLVVLTIVMMVFAGLSSTMFRRDNTRGVAEIARDVQTIVYRARANAIGTGIPQRVWLDLEAKQFSYGSNELVSVPENIGLKVTTGRELISAAGNIELVFLADGSSSGMDVVFSNASLDENQPAQRLKTKLRVNWLTGLPSIVPEE
ncbi:MAG: prepilin-type N-terminal cleavage/methylation domain-containing protein [Rhizobiaceae bacterium]|nr:prepilin-type N-terminal cleavage/methylation domain-containing protein [Rhizobiaceae bacterium]